MRSKPLSLNANSKIVSEAAKADWDREFREFYYKKKKSDKEAKKVNKVLEKMKVPDKFKGILVEPLVIHWRPINAEGTGEPKWSVLVKNLHLKFKPDFFKINYFSVSLYLRKLLKKGKKYIDLEMPQVEERLKIVNNLLGKK